MVFATLNMLDSASYIAAGIVALLAAAAALTVVVRARRAGLALHRQLDDLHDAVAAQRTALGEEIAGLRRDLLDHSARSARIEEEQKNSTVQVSRAREELQRLSETVDDLLAGIAKTADAVGKPAQLLVIDPRLVDASTEDQLIAQAESIAVLRPLVPWPKWRHDADWSNPDLCYRLRRWFWQYFHERRREAPVVIPWHYGSRLRLFLGNDISSQIYISGCFEPNEFAFLDRILQPGMTFVDAGANEGIYTVFAGCRVGASGMVWAFEPSRRELERLQHNLHLNQLAARVFPVALAEGAGQAELSVAGYQHEAHNTLGAFAYEGVEAARTEIVEMVRLDDVVEREGPPRVDVIKIDVEGAEIRALRGAAGTLARYRPVLLFEVSEASLHHQGGNREELLALVRSQNYRIYAFDPMTGSPVPAGPGVFTANMIGVPEEKPLPETIHLPWPLPQGQPHMVL